MESRSSIESSGKLASVQYPADHSQEQSVPENAPRYVVKNTFVEPADEYSSLQLRRVKSDSDLSGISSTSSSLELFIHHEKPHVNDSDKPHNHQLSTTSSQRSSSESASLSSHDAA